MYKTFITAPSFALSPAAAGLFGAALLTIFVLGAATGSARPLDTAASESSAIGNDNGEDESPVGYSCDPDPGGGMAPIICTGAIDPASSLMQFSLDWHHEAGPDERVIDAITITDRLTARPIQIIKPVASRAPMSLVANGFEFIDMNFDGYADLRLVKTTTAGSNVYYSNWLWSPEQEIFVKDDALDALSSPSFDAEMQEVSARNRSSAADYQTDFYAYDGPELVLTHRESDHYFSGTPCQRTYFDRIGDDWKETGTGPCKD